MLRWERGTVKAALGSWPGVDRLEIELEGGAEILTAIAYPELTGSPQPGETVLLNTNAVRRELGTGGDAMVVARPDVLPQAGAIDGRMVRPATRRCRPWSTPSTTLRASTTRRSAPPNASTGCR